MSRVYLVLIFLLNIVGGFFWLSGQWPGLFILDTFVEWQDAEVGEYHLWTSYLMSIFIRALISVWNSPAMWSAAQIFLASAVNTFIFYELAQRTKKPILLMLSLLIWMNPFIGLMNIFLNRDILNGWLSILLVFFTFRISLTFNYEKSFDKNGIFAIIILTSLLSNLRKENLLLVPAIIISIFFIYGFKHRISYFFSALILSGTLLVNLIIPYFLFSSGPKAQYLLEYEYLLTTRINPLSYILVNGYKERITQAEIAEIGKVIPYQSLLDQHTEYEIQPFHENSSSIHLNKNEFEQFDRIYWSIIAKNIFLFMENRNKMFSAILGLSKKAFYYCDNYFKDFEVSKSFIKDHASYPQTILFPKLKENQLFAVNFLIDNKFSKILLCSCCLGLCFLVLSFILSRICPAYFVAGFLIFIRLPAVYLFAPASQFKYLYYLFLFGMYGLILLYLELITKNKQTNPV